MITNLEPYVTLMKVMFVCSGNAFRSPVAEALLKKSKAGCGRELNACMYAYPHSKHAIFIILEPSIMLSLMLMLAAPLAVTVYRRKCAPKHLIVSQKTN